MSNAIRSRTARGLWALGGIACAALILGAAWMALRQSPTAPLDLPSDAGTGLDPAVGRLLKQVAEAAQKEPRSAAAWGRLGSVLMQYEFVEPADSAFQRAMHLAPLEPRWPYLRALLWMNRDSDRVTWLLGAAAGLVEHDSPDIVRLRLAEFLLELGRHEEAEAEFNRLLRIAPGHVRALLGLARIRQSRGQWADASSFLEPCLTNRYTAKQAQALRASVELALGHRDAAESAARLNQSLRPDIPWPDPFSDELTVYRVSLKERLADANALLDRGHTAEALSILSGLRRDYPDDGETWYLTGWALNQFPEPERAEQALREHLRRVPDSTKGKAQLAIALLATKRYAEAIPVLESALQSKPTWRELHSNLGYACVQLGRDEEALLHYREALSQDPAHIPSYIAVAELLARRRQGIEALRLLDTALQLAPTDVRIQRAREKLSRTDR